ncbi:hypothetical protein [Paenibacillus sp. Leaf72]|uniref:hypothetical protein n=1 Tax=Paenibacillus sp. Leaf72 TaxID=1736234 RepID=UPI0006FBD60D|nr:hypothetical protein [Paenibacillus sp. Leaf72]KQN97000.1 hypothetical protein ASF12_23310 [Paenibacillus sp. Leaf72]
MDKTENTLMAEKKQMKTASSTTKVNSILSLDILNGFLIALAAQNNHELHQYAFHLSRFDHSGDIKNSFACYYNLSENAKIDLRLDKCSDWQVELIDACQHWFFHDITRLRLPNIVELFLKMLHDYTGNSIQDVHLVSNYPTYDDSYWSWSDYLLECESQILQLHLSVRKPAETQLSSSNISDR